MSLKKKCFSADARLAKEIELADFSSKNSKYKNKKHVTDWFLQMLLLDDFSDQKSRKNCFSSQSEIIRACRNLVLNIFSQHNILINKEIEIFIQASAVAMACYLLAYVDPAGRNLAQNKLQADLFVKKLDDLMTSRELKLFRGLWQKNSFLEFKKTLFELNLILTHLSNSVVKKARGKKLNVRELHDLLKVNRRGFYLNSFEHHQFLLGLHFRYGRKFIKSNVKISGLFAKLNKSQSVVDFIHQISEL